MKSVRAFGSVFALMVVVTVGGGCDYYAKPHRPLPASFSVDTLDGQRLVPESMRGKPWVISLWLPG